jgi:D-sedoheptulose 7-phosphate isomerase
MSHSDSYLREAAAIIEKLDRAAIEALASELFALRERGGRLFVLGVGGGAANASHAVNDFRKICGIEAYTPTDNVAELTARINDDGWESSFVEWLKVSRLSRADMVLVFSVGGGSLEKNVSPNLVRALEHARSAGARITGVVGRDGGHTARLADACVIVPTVNRDAVTAHTEAFQALIWHLLVSHPLLQRSGTKWESMQ